MQSSGVGNCVNMLSLAKNCRFPLVILVTMRGEWAEFNPWQVPMGIKDAGGARTDGRAGLPRRARRRRRRHRRRRARHRLQRRPRGRGAAVAAADRRQTVGRNERAQPPLSTAAPRFASCSTSAAICWSSPGSARPPGTPPRSATTSAISTCGARWGRRRWSASVSRSRSRTGAVLVVTGDGDMLMGLGALATIGVAAPPNLAIAVFDNGRYGETGMQPSHTAQGGRPRRRRPRLRHQGNVRHRDESALASSPARSTGRATPCSPASRSAPTSRRGCCRRATASC